MLDEIELDLVRLLQRDVVLGQGAFDLDRVADVLKRHQRGAVGQPHGAAVDDAAVDPLDAPQDRLARVDRRHRGVQRLPRLRIAVERAEPFDHRLDMGALPEQGWRKLPHPREGRVVQPHPAVAAEQRHCLGKIVERLALDPCQRIVPAFEVEALGDVIEQVGHAAIGTGGRHHAQAALIRQVPFVDGGFAGAPGAVKLGLPGAEIALLGQEPRRPQAIDHGGIGRVTVQESGVDLPQRTVGGIVEGQIVVGAEDRDSGGELVEGAAMRVHR